MIIVIGIIVQREFRFNVLVLFDYRFHSKIESVPAGLRNEEERQQEIKENSKNKQKNENKNNKMEGNKKNMGG